MAISSIIKRIGIRRRKNIKKVDIMEKQRDLMQGILNYIDMPSSGALMITGVWGCGKTHFVKNVIIPYLESEENKMSIIVSLYGVKDMCELPQRIISQYLEKGKGIKLDNFSNRMKNIAQSFPKLGEWVNFEKLLGETICLLDKIVPRDTVIFVDDIERASDLININEIFGSLNELIENFGYKVVMIAHKEHIDKKYKDINVFYEKVIEKHLVFTPDIVSIYKSLINEYQDEKDIKFRTIMNQEDFLEVVNPDEVSSKEQKTLMQNIRTLKFAISHMKVVFDGYLRCKIDIDDEKTCKYILNQWKFIYGLSIELKRNKISLDNNFGLSQYSEIAKFDIDFTGEDIDLFPCETLEDSESSDKDPDFAKNFCQKYYRKESDHYIYYPALYDFVVGGASIDFDMLHTYTKNQMSKFEYSVNPAQEILDKFLNGFWNFNDNEAKNGLNKLLNAVENGELHDVISYYNASVFIFRFANIIDKTESDINDAFYKGIDLFFGQVDCGYTPLFNLIPVENGTPCEGIYNKLKEKSDEKIAKQDESRIQNLVGLFKNDTEQFLSQLIENNGFVSDFASRPILNNIGTDVIKDSVKNMQPYDFANLNTMIRQRKRYLGSEIEKEKRFYSDLRNAVLTRKDENSISGFYISNILIKGLDELVQ